MEFGELSIDRTRVSDQVKKILKQAMMDGKLKPGDKIPTEEKMAQQFKVSKVTLREALREMEAEGLIEKRRGANGGSFVTQPGSEKMSNLVINYYRFGEIAPEELAEFRQILEPAIVALAAARRTEEDLEAIRTNIEVVKKDLKQGKINRPKGLEFHRLIADASHNRLIRIVIQALTMVFEDILLKIPFTLKEAQIDLEFSKKFYDCVLHRQSDEARELMIAHFDTLKKIIERKKLRRNYNKRDPP